MKARARPARRTVITDGALALALLALCVLVAPLITPWIHGQRAIDPLGYVLLGASCLPIALRRRFPSTVLAVVAVAVSAYLVAGFTYGPVFLPLMVAVYTVGRSSPTRWALLMGAGAFIAFLAHVFAGPVTVDAFGAGPAAAWVAIPLTIGIARRLIGESQARERAETERRKLDDERLRLATEVHDIVGHGLAAIQMQADIALHIADSKPDQARIALQAISTASAAALSELRTTLRSITPETASGNASDLRAPTPGLARVDDLCHRIRAAGVQVDLSVTGQARPIPPAVDVAAYRIVQESLTNVVRHAVAPRATVRIGYLTEAVSVVVISPHDGTTLDEGFGIHGMRRRIEQVGGDFTLEYGSTVEVRALLPAPAQISVPGDDQR